MRESYYFDKDTKLPEFLPYPKYLLNMDITQTARGLYALLLSRATLSRKNNWVDLEGHVYLNFTIENCAIALGKCETTIKKAMKELDEADLLERKAVGFGKPNRLYVKIFCEGQDSEQMLFGNHVSGDYTVIDLVERYIAQKQGVRQTTRANYQTTVNRLKRDRFGQRKIKDIKVSDAKLWLIQLQNNGLGYSSIQNVRGVLRTAFQMAVDDDLLPKNPFEFPILNVIKNDSEKRESITIEQQERFLEFVQKDKHYS